MNTPSLRFVWNPLLALAYLAVIIFITAISIGLFYEAFQTIETWLQTFTQQASHYFTQFSTRN